MSDKIAQLAELINTYHKILFFGGAGVSTESGIPDYRSEKGIYTEMQKRNKDASKTMHIDYIVNHPQEFFNRKREKRDPDTILPNHAHKVLAQWEHSGKDVRVVTQNVDGLHQKAGHLYVAEIHGNGQTWFCMKCKRHYPAEAVPRDQENVPRCLVDGGLVRPNVTYFGEWPNQHEIQKAQEAIAQSELLIIAGTSLKVSPAKGLLRHYKGEKIVVINHDFLKIRKKQVDLFIQDSVGETLKKVDDLLKNRAH